MLSIITSLYRSDRYIRGYRRHLLKTAAELSRLGVPFEVVCIVNDATPRERRLGDQLASNAWFRLLHVPRETLYATWNRGVRESKGSACTFWNADDIRFAPALKEGLDHITAGAPLVYYSFDYKRYLSIGPFKILGKHYVHELPDFERNKFLNGMFCGPFFMFAKTLFDTVGPFDESYKIAGDYEWCVRAANEHRFVKARELGGVHCNDGKTLSGKGRAQAGTPIQIENARVREVSARLLAQSRD